SGRLLDLQPNNKGCSRKADPAQTKTPPYAHCPVPSPASPVRRLPRSRLLRVDAVGLGEGQIGSREKSCGHQFARVVPPRPSIFAWRQRHLPLVPASALTVLQGRHAVEQASNATRGCGRLGMHVLGEPVGWQLMAKPAALGLAVDHRAGSGELIAKPDI